MTKKLLYQLSHVLVAVLASSVICIKPSFAIDSELKKEDQRSNEQGAFVLVRRSAQFFDQIPPSSRVSNRSKRMYKAHRLNRAFVAHLLKLGPHWAKIAIGKQTDQNHCLSEHEKGRFFYLEIYVKRSDLVPVIKKAITQKFSDGTEFTLWPGLPLRGSLKDSTSVNAYRVHASHFSFSATLTRNAVGLSWEGSQLNSQKLPKFQIKGATKLQINGQNTIQVQHTDDLILVDQIAQVDQKALVQFNEPCLRIKALVAKDMVEKANYVIGSAVGGMGLGGTGFGFSKSSKYTLKKGTELRWLNGHSAGHTLEDYVFGQSQIVPHNDHQMCFKLRMASAFGRPKQSQPLIACAHQERSVDHTQ